MMSWKNGHTSRNICVALGVVVLLLVGVIAGFRLGKNSHEPERRIEPDDGAGVSEDVGVKPRNDLAARRGSGRTGRVDEDGRPPAGTVRRLPPVAGADRSVAVEPPVFLVDSNSAETLSVQVHEFLLQSLVEAGPDKENVGRQLLESDKPLLRTCGAMLLIETGTFSEEDLRAVAADPDLSVSLNALGWLRDMGYGEKAGELMESLQESVRDEDTLIGLIYDETVLSTGKRILLDMVGAQLSSEQAASLYNDIIGNEDIDHSVRMKSAILLRGTTDFETYREEIDLLAGQVSEKDLRDSLKRLSEQLEGPVEVHTDPPAIGGDDIDERLARSYPGMIEDLALHIEFVLASEDSVVDKGTSAVLKEYLDDFEGQPLTPEQQISLKRLQSLNRKIAEKEAR